MCAIRKEAPGKFKVYNDGMLAFVEIDLNIGNASLLFVARHTAHQGPGMKQMPRTSPHFLETSLSE
jgi:hypothetical protein